MSASASEFGRTDPATSHPELQPSRSDSLPLGARQLRASNDNPSAGPQQFGPFRLQRELGRGANGVVYLARRTDDARPMALKILLGGGDENPEALARFELEAQIASKLQHPGIVQVLDAGHVGRHRYCALEYCAGLTLKQRLADGPLPPQTAAAVVAKLARAADYAHGLGVLHRDLKPANVLLDPTSGDPRVTDFGLAQDHSLRRSLTRTGDVLGTPAFMAPEQILGQRDVDRRVDVYALGVTLYQCLTGKLPYCAETIPQLVQVVLRGGARPPSELEPKVPSALSDACLRAMASQRESRFPSAAAFADALEAAIVPGREPSPPPARALPRWSAPLLGIAGGLALGFTAYAVLSGAAGEPTPVAPSSSEPPEAAPPELSPPPPTPVRELAPDAELKVLGALLTDQFRLVRAHGLPDVWATVQPRLEALRTAYPEDPRLPVFAVYRQVTHRRASALELYRAVSKLGPRDPSLPPTFAGIVARFVAAVGFQRAGRDLVEAASESGLEHPWAGLSLMHLRSMTLPPVRDVERACEAAEATAQVLERGGQLTDPGANPPAWDVYINLALYRLHLDQHEAALEAAERAASLADAEWARNLRALSERIRRKQMTPSNALDNVNGLFGVDDLARTITPRRGKVSLSEPLREAQRLEAALPGFSDHAPSAALLEVSAARAYARARRAERALELLERARARLGENDRDVRHLVDRCLARVLLDFEREPTRAAELARGVTEATGLSRGERADAWILLARAKKAQGDADAAQRALDSAADLDPYDRRELNRLR